MAKKKRGIPIQLSQHKGKPAGANVIGPVTRRKIETDRVKADVARGPRKKTSSTKNPRNTFQDRRLQERKLRNEGGKIRRKKK